jgi:hypothetical protein
MSAEKMKDLVRRGQVTRMHELSVDGMSWRTSEEFTELYPQKVKAAVVERVNIQSESKVAAESTTQPTKAKVEDQWFAHVNDDQQGPLSEMTIRQWAKAGSVTHATMVWKQGMQEWEEAGTLRPDWFAKPNSAAATSSVTASDSSEVPMVLIGELQRRKVWVYVLSITGVVLTSLYVISMIFALVTQIAAPADSGGKALIGVTFSLFFFVLGVLALISCISLIQYANTLSVLHYAPTRDNLLRSLKKLSTFWLFAGICVLSVLVVTFLGVLLTYTVGIRLVHILGN